VDVVLGVLNDSPLILRNDGTKHHWLGIRLNGTNQIGKNCSRVVVIDSNESEAKY